MFWKTIIICIIVILCIGIAGCGGAEAEMTTTSPSEQAAAPASTPTAQTTPQDQNNNSQTQKPSAAPVVKETGQKNYYPSPEAKGIIDLSFSPVEHINEFDPVPKMQITVKNTSPDKPLEISGMGEKWDTWFMKVSSLDKAGQVIGQPQYLDYSLNPGQSNFHIVRLYDSDKTDKQTCRIELTFKKIPQIAGNYTDSSNVKDKLEITRRFVANQGILSLKVTVKNIFSQRIGDFRLTIIFKDASGKTIGLMGKTKGIFQYGGVLKPGGTIDDCSFYAPDANSGLTDYNLSLTEGTVFP